MAFLSAPKDNHVLKALPAEDYARLVPYLEPITMPFGWTLHDCGHEVSHLYFPTTSIVSRLYVMEDGASSEIAVTGNEGLVGICLFLGVGHTPYRAVVQCAGSGYRVKASIVKKELARGGALQHLGLRYTQALITQMSQTAICNRYHALDQQLCRWLLRNLDLIRGNELKVTQELIANLLGVRREGVTVAALKLQADGLIRYRRGHITVLDRPSLESRVCECYAVVKREYERLLPYEVSRTQELQPQYAASGFNSARGKQSTEWRSSLAPA
ncbi:MAG: Crp/Fnr family transcriptional regulator [Candidatus Obscuribacterales bacterium]|nr:Crp/Fnr family transcriptional regulator [Steroidobacteraceae bacterium]